MKKIILTISLAIIVLTAAACGGGKPSGFSKNTYDLGKKALTVMEKYDDMEITKSEAKERLEDIRKALENEDLDDLIQESNNLLVKLEISQFIYALDGTGSIYDAENDLRDLLEGK